MQMTGMKAATWMQLFLLCVVLLLFFATWSEVSEYANLKNIFVTCPVFKYGMSRYDSSKLEECYWQAQKRYEFGEPLEQVEVIAMGPERNDSSLLRGIIVIMSTSHPSDLYSLKTALTRLQTSFLHSHAYPVAIVHEDFTEGIMKDLCSYVSTRLHFLEVRFRIPQWLEEVSNNVPRIVRHWPYPHAPTGLTHMHGLIPYGKRESFGYYHMCRFFAGAGFMLPFFNDYDWYMRLDTDSWCNTKSFDGDIFKQMVAHNKTYAYWEGSFESGQEAEGLWDFAREYAEQIGADPSFLDKALKTMESRYSAEYGWIHGSMDVIECSKESKTTPNNAVTNLEDGTKVYQLPCNETTFHLVPTFSTNFEVASIQLLQSEKFQLWFNAVDSSGGIYLHRWGDAPLRFVGLSLVDVDMSQIEKVQGCPHAQTWWNELWLWLWKQ